MGRRCWGWVPQIGVRSSSRAVRGQPGSHPSALPQTAALLPHILCDELSQNSVPAVGRLLQTPVGWSIAAPQDVPSSQHSSRRSQRRILCHYHRVKPRETPKPANWRHLCVSGCAGSCGAGRSVPLCAALCSEGFSSSTSPALGSAPHKQGLRVGWRRPSGLCAAGWDLSTEIFSR